MLMLQTSLSVLTSLTPARTDLSAEAAVGLGGRTPTARATSSNGLQNTGPPHGGSWFAAADGPGVDDDNNDTAAVAVPSDKLPASAASASACC